MPSQINLNVLRIVDSNGKPVPGAKVTFSESGTSTPVTVYTDDSLATAYPSPLVADSQGVVPFPFTDGATAVKVDVTTAAGASVNGYPIDPVQLVSSSGSAASQVSFAPITGNSATDVQGAIQNLTTLWNAVTSYGKSLIAAIDAPAARTVLGLGSASTRAAEDALTNGSNLPDGAAVTSYVTGYGTKLFSANGYAKLPGGLIVQWEASAFRQTQRGQLLGRSLLTIRCCKPLRALALTSILPAMPGAASTT